MKKEEALILALEKSKLVIEYITQILSDTNKVNGIMEFSSAKIEGQKMCTLSICVPEKGFEKHLNLGITTDHCDVLYQQVVNDFIDQFLENETMGVSKYFSVKGIMGNNFSGMNALNSTGSKIKINFLCQGKIFDEIMSDYNKRIDEYIENINNNQPKSM